MDKRILTKRQQSKNVVMHSQNCLDRSKLVSEKRQSIRRYNLFTDKKGPLSPQLMKEKK